MLKKIYYCPKPGCKGICFEQIRLMGTKNEFKIYICDTCADQIVESAVIVNNIYVN